MPKLAGYKTVGQLKDAAVAELGEGAAQGGQTGSSQFQDYEVAVMEALLEEYRDGITAARRTIESDSNPQRPYNVGRALLPLQRTNYLIKLRNDYGAGSSHAQAMVNAITTSLQPKLEILRTHLQEAKESRQRWQGLGAIGASIAVGAAIGAGIGAWGGVVGALPGAVIGGIVGGVIGLGAAIAIWSD